MMYEIPFFEAAGHNDLMSKVGRTQFPDPWCDYASSDMPRNLNAMLRWGIRLWHSNGIYKTAMMRVVRYFITNVNIKTEKSESEAEKYQEFFKELDLPWALGLLGMDYISLGNSFSSLHVPFIRSLQCPACGYDRPLQSLNRDPKNKDYEWGRGDFKFHGTCPSCKRKVEFKRRDRRDKNRARKVRVIRWNPLHMQIKYNPFSHETEYWYQIPKVQEDAIRRGDENMLASTPWEIVECVRQKKLLKFDRNALFHMREDALAGIDHAGWGIAGYVSSFRQAYYSQVMHRYNEALAMDYIVPVRVTYPEDQGDGGVAANVHMGMYKDRVLNMFQEHRRDPASWHFLPFKVGYATLGGEGAQMATHELLNAANTELLDCFGVPLEMHRGTLKAEAAPMALRMFQQLWYHIPSQYNRWVQWAADRGSEFNNWELAEVSLQPVTQADDLEKKQILLQLASANKMSLSTALAPYDINVRDEMEKMYAEQRVQGELEKEFQKKMQEQEEVEMKMQELEEAQNAPPMPPGGGGMPPPGGGMPQPGAAGAPVGGGAMNIGQQMTPQSPQEMLQQAEQMAQQLLQLDEVARKQQLKALKDSDEAMWALVKAKMQTLRQAASMEGQQMVLQQGGAQPPA